MKNRIIAVVMVALLISCSCIPLASAADVDVEGSGAVYLESYDWVDMVVADNEAFEVSYPRNGANSSPVDVYSPSYTGNRLYVNVDAIDFGMNPGYLKGAIGIYASYYFTSTVNFKFDGTPTYELSYENDLGDIGSGSVSVSTFTPAYGGAQYVSTGFLLKSGTTADGEFPVSMFSLNATHDPNNNIGVRVTGSNSYYLYVPSMRLVITDTQEELKALESIADDLASQYELLNAMYGDIMSALNQIYIRTGSILETQELANTYLSQIGSTLQSLLSTTNSINTTTSNIYTLLGTQLAALIQAVNTASTDIQSAIAQQTQDIIDYLDNVFGTAVGELPGKTDDLQGQIDNNDVAEKDYQNSAQTQFEDLFTDYGGGLTGDVLNSTFYVVSLFESVWSGLGDYVIVYTFPLFLGLCLLIVGRLSRFGGGSTSRNKGDSDDA